MNARGALCALCACILLVSGCIRQTPTLGSVQTPAPTPTPTLPPVELAYTREEEVDANGARIYDANTHYHHYVTFSYLRVYEYAEGTLLDGLCTNQYNEPLEGTYEIVFMDAQGVIVAKASLYFGESLNHIPAGECPVYAQIDTDIDIQTLPFEIAATSHIRPAA